MKVKQNLIDMRMHSLKSPETMDEVKYIVIHERKSSQGADIVVNYCRTSPVRAGFHIAIDDREIIQMIPFERIAFANGDGYDGEYNRHAISVEICCAEDYEMDRYYKAVNNAITYVKHLMNVFNISIDNVITHHSISGYDCPHRLLQENKWDWFKAKLGGKK